MIYALLFWEFLKIGLFAVGGGLAALPFLYNLSDHYNWFNYHELIDMIAVAESTPGPLGINMATYIGFKVAGVGGSLVASLSLILPSIAITTIICTMLKRFRESKQVQWAFYGLRPAVAGLIGAIALSLLQIAIFKENFRFGAAVDIKALLLSLLLLPAVFKLKQHPIVYIALAALVGIIFKF
ncbi:MAG: chromate transporter [Firmicutes bacterium]|nr:chromate transporter [Bacillota bacterium]